MRQRPESSALPHRDTGICVPGKIIHVSALLPKASTIKMLSAAIEDVPVWRVYRILIHS
jgi:hypothetical protein